MMVKDIHSNGEFEILVGTAKLRNYNNDKNVITMTAKLVDSNDWVDFKKEGRVVDAEEKLSVWNNPVLFMYAKAVKYDAITNDPNKKIWKNVVKIVKDNSQKYFTKSGNWRKVIGANVLKGTLELHENNHK